MFTIDKLAADACKSAVSDANTKITPALRTEILGKLVDMLNKRRSEGSDENVSALTPSLKRLCDRFKLDLDPVSYEIKVVCDDPDGARARYLLSIGSTWFLAMDVDSFLMSFVEI